jgi:hypothetical protein
MLVPDESMSAWVPHASKTGGLPNISFIKRMLEPRGKLNFASADCCFFYAHLYFSYLAGSKILPVEC